jgi:hypothetical protein
VEALELRVSNLALVPLLCGLEHHVIMGSALPARRFLVVDLIKQEHVLVIGGPVVFQILQDSLMVRLGGIIIGISYDTIELHSKLGIDFNAIHGVHQPSMNL